MAKRNAATERRLNEEKFSFYKHRRAEELKRKAEPSEDEPDEKKMRRDVDLVNRKLESLKDKMYRSFEDRRADFSDHIDSLSAKFKVVRKDVDTLTSNNR